MKKAGDVLLTLFDQKFVTKAQGYTNLFDSWTDITAKNGIAAAAAHSRIKELERGIVLIEMDHPGWKQILQTKQSKLLNDFRIRFPDMNIVGISLLLGSGKLPKTPDPPEPPCKNIPDDFAQVNAEGISFSGINAIKDNDLREKLIKLGQTIAKRESGNLN